ncbi:MAG: hypothetical protein RLZZ330_1020, partial [Actinomycetota bacterium]
LGHAFAAFRFNQKIEGIHLHLFGGHTAFSKKFPTAKIQFWTAIAGPIATAILAAGVYFFLPVTTGAIHSFLIWLMWSCVAITLVNLLPGSPLDGGQVLASIVWSIKKDERKGAIAAGYGGYFVAALWLASPFLYEAFLGWEITAVDIFFSAMIGSWLFSNARLSIKIARMPVIDLSNMDVLHQLEIRDVARRAISVNKETSLADALAQMRTAGAGSVLIEDNAEIIGIVHEKFLEHPSESDLVKRVAELAVKTNSREWLNFRERVLHNPKIDPSYIHGQWVVVDDANAIYGVLHRSDVSSRLKVSE